MLETLFWILIVIIVYAYIGYTIILFIFSLPKKNILKAEEISTTSGLPKVTHVIAAYNEKNIIPDKVKNCQLLNYPPDKICHLWITDGSNDGSAELLNNIRGTKVLHQNERKGKTTALNRALLQVSTPITVFSDANAMLSKDAIKNLVLAFNNKQVGCVAGEKRIVFSKKDKASGAGEGFYWNYESYIKKLEALFDSTMGAVGELYAIRTSLYQPPPGNVILDDFVISMQIAQQGFKINYAANAFAEENSSISIREEMKRKVRIAAGGFQFLFNYPGLLNFLKHPKLSYQYFSHKVLRWFAVPASLFFLLITNGLIVINEPQRYFYSSTLLLQCIFYSFALLGHFLRNKPLKFKVFFIPYYITIMNISQILGFLRYIRGKQKVTWEKAQR